MPLCAKSESEVLFFFLRTNGSKQVFNKCISIKKWKEVLVALFDESAPTIASIFGPFVADLFPFLPKPQPEINILIY